MRILLLNDGYFLHSLRNVFDCEVFYASPAPEADLQLELRPVHIQQILERCPFQPDIVLVSDAINLRTAVTGFENITIPLVFFGVDAPMNVFWQKDFAAACDLTFLDQFEQVDKLQTHYPDRKERFHWLPLAADPYIYKRVETEKLHDIAFVGSLNHHRRPKRTWILQELQKHFNVAVLDGEGRRAVSPADVVQVYNQSKIVLNENLFPGINLRTFEVMATGACLLTEENGGSFDHLFNNWEHLVSYTPENIIATAQTLLQDDQLREKIAQQGMNAVLDKHTVDHRAKTLIDKVQQFISDKRKKQLNGSRSIALGKSFLEQSNRWPQQPIGQLKSESIRLLMLQIERGCETAELHYELAVEALKQERHHDALKSLRRSREIDPCHMRSRWAAFWVHWEQKLYPSAAAEIEKLSHHFRLKKLSQKLIERLTRGKPLNHQDFICFGQIMEKAGWLLETGVDRSLDHPVRWNAFDCYQEAIALKPKSFDPYYHCAKLLDENGSPEFAVLFAEQALKHKPWNAELNVWLGILLLNSHRREEALRQLTHYLVNFTDADKWEQVESLPLREDEWQQILTHVLHSCRASVADHMPDGSEKAIRKRTLNNISMPLDQTPPLESKQN
ncbi:glycosyltransferase [bacterium]|nr:glycosyltransferase [bacterium]MBU1881692.1 glycosyltransferase [bacterium]